MLGRGVTRRGGLPRGRDGLQNHGAVPQRGDAAHAGLGLCSFGYLPAVTLHLPYRDLLATRGAEGFCAVQLMLPAESAHDTVAALGEVGLLQFKDLNPDKSAFHRTFANRVRAGALRAQFPA